MPGSGDFMTLAGLGVSFAGFAGSISAPGRRPDAHSPVRMRRIRNIVADAWSRETIGSEDGEDLPLAGHTFELTNSSRLELEP